MPSSKQLRASVHGSNLSLLLLGIFMICIGDGAIRACLPALGGDQFDKSDPTEQKLKTFFFLKTSLQSRSWKQASSTRTPSPSHSGALLGWCSSSGWRTIKDGTLDFRSALELCSWALLFGLLDFHFTGIGYHPEALSQEFCR